MARTATVAKIDPEAQRQLLARELLGIERAHAGVFDRVKEIKALLLEGVDESYKIAFPGLGSVSVSAPKERRLVGTAPELIIEEFLALPDKERKSLEKLGLVHTVEQWKDEYSGRVTTKLFGPK